MFDRKRREFITLLGDAAIAGMLVTGSAHAQTDFPNRPIHMVVPYPAGGIVDIATRIVTGQAFRDLAPADRSRSEAGGKRQPCLGPGLACRA